MLAALSASEIPVTPPALGAVSDSAIKTANVKLNRIFEINENVQKITDVNAKSVADAVESTGHTLVKGDLRRCSLGKCTQ